MTDKNKYFEKEKQLATEIKFSIDILKEMEKVLKKKSSSAKFFSANDTEFKIALDTLEGNDPRGNVIGSLVNIVDRSQELAQKVLKFETDHLEGLRIEKERITELNKHDIIETNRNWVWKSMRWIIGVMLAVFIYSTISAISDQCDPQRFWRIPIKDFVVDCPVPSKSVATQSYIEKDT